MPINTSIGPPLLSQQKNWSVVNTQTKTHMEFKIQMSCLNPYEKKREKFKERHD